MSRFSPYIEISLDNLIHNLNQVRALPPGTRGVLAVVKDNAYGCGALPVARALEKEGVSFFAVARTPEARCLRDGGIHGRILVLGQVDADDLQWAVGKEIDFSITDLQDVRRWISTGYAVNAQCLIDTGMQRMGIPPNEVSFLINLLKAHPQISLQGVFTHFTSADVAGSNTVNLQKEMFRACLKELKAAGADPRFTHYANSAGIARHPVDECTLIRPGIVLYGCNPDPVQDFGLNLLPVASLIAPVVKVREVVTGTPVSYGGTYVTDRPTRIATIAAGYAQGVPRMLSNKGQVLIDGKKFPIAGRVTMDYTMVDIGNNAAIAAGHSAAIFGCQGSECITVDAVAQAAQTIGYEVLCGLSASVPRLYLRNGAVVDRIEGLCF